MASHTSKIALLLALGCSTLAARAEGPMTAFDPKAWETALLAERKQTAEAFKDGKKSPYAAIARFDFKGDAWMTFGSAKDCDVPLEGLSAHHARVQVQGDSFVIEALDADATFVAKGVAADARTARLGPGGAKLELGRYVLRLSHQNFPAAVVLDPQSPRLAEGKPPQWFAPDVKFRVTAHLERDPKPREEIVMSTRGNKRHALRLGKLEFTLEGKPLSLTALRLLEPGNGEASVSIFFRDLTTGHESYPVGRYIDAEAVPGHDGDYTLDFNAAYNPTCAFSQLYNCPIPPRENRLDVAVRAGERDPGNH
ncbi:MAG: DUF1684 domain-containing protein [Deltaproteobacteria bacterium]|nr:DUF1684 domain-containing protein [Deltaproteobacteria bacterium]